MFLDDGRVGFLDWGLSRVSTHLRDVSYFLTMSVDIDERRANERELLQGYLDALRAAGGVDIAFDDAWAAHRLHASYTVVATFLAYMPSYAASDGVGLGDALLARSDAALEDLEVVGPTPSAETALDNLRRPDGNWSPNRSRVTGARRKLRRAGHGPRGDPC